MALNQSKLLCKMQNIIYQMQNIMYVSKELTFILILIKSLCPQNSPMLVTYGMVFYLVVWYGVVLCSGLSGVGWCVILCGIWYDIHILRWYCIV